MSKRRKLTVQERIASRNRGNVKHGTQPGWADEALDFYLNGFEMEEITSCFGVTRHTVYNCIAKAALYRLMIQRQAERLDEMKELTDAPEKRS